MKKKYKSDLILRPGTFIFGLGALFFCFYFLLSIVEYSIWPIDSRLGRVVQTLLGMITAAFSMIVAVNPDDPIPWNFALLFGVGFLTVVFCPLPLVGAGQIILTIIGLFGRRKVKD